MQKDKHTDFDLEMQEIFLNAEENVPSRLWESISEELDRRDHRKVIALRWRRAAAGVAAIAAVLSGIFIISRQETELLQTEPSRTMAEDISIEKQIEASSQLFLADIPDATGPAVSASIPSSVLPAESFSQTYETFSDEEKEMEQAAEKVEPVRKREPHETHGHDNADVWPDPFSNIDEESKGRSRAVSFTLSGNVMSNDATSGGAKAKHASPIGSLPKTGITEKSISTYGIPLSLGIGARIQLTDKWSLGTGIDWTLLSRSFTGIYTEVDSKGNITKSINSDITNDLHYIGIPLNLYFNVLTNRDIKFYAWGGTSAEKGILNKYRIHSEPKDIFYSEKVSGIQWSVGLGLGLEFALNDHLGLYIDPSARYYFECDQPNSVRTQKPYMLNFEAGLRFNL